MDKSSLFKEFNEGLNQEIEYIKESGGDAKFILRNGQLVDNYGGKFVYEFITDVPIELDDDTPINIRYGSESISGGIITVNGLKVLLGLNEDIGTKIPEITITASAYFLLEFLQERINDIESQKLVSNIDIAMKVFGFKRGLIDKDYNFLTPPSELGFLSKEQKESFAQCLGSEVTFTWGPPGTGKTTMLSYLANELLMRDNSILVVSHTNVAIDNALEQISNILKSKKDEKYFGGAVLRIGNSPDKDFFDKFPELNLDYWIKEKSKELIKELSGLEKKLEKEVRVLDELNALLELFSSTAATEKKIERFKINIEKTKSDLQGTKNNLREIKNKIKDTTEKLRRSENSNFIGRILAGLNPKKLKKLLEELSSSLIKENNQLSCLQEKLNNQENNLRDVEKEHDESKHRLIELSKGGAILEETKIAEKANKQKEIIRDISQQIENIKNAIQELGRNIINEAKLIGTTITKGYLNQDIYSRKFDAVIVDEASMASLPALFFDCGLTSSKVIVIGDFRQLAPIAMANSELAKKWLRRDIFEVSGITEKINNNDEEERLTILKEQRRMPQEIAELVNKPIYKGNLITKEKPQDKHNTEKEVINSKPFPKEKVILCDTSEFNPWCARSPVRRSPFNIYNALLSVYLAEQAISGGISDVTILTPYRAQNSLIHKLVADKASIDQNFRKITPSSVHRFQGRESELIILDLVEGPLKEIKWMGGGFDSEAMRLINVAITRARAKIIFIANLKYLKKKLREGSILKQILENVEKNYPIVNTQEFFQFIKIPVKKTKPLKLDEITPQLYNQAYFYKAFQNDLLNAKKEIVIISPFITHNRLSSFEGTFRELQKKEIKTFIFTRPLKAQGISYTGGKELKDNLRKLGVELNDNRPLSHEKLSIIDGKIVWSGSLNILSHKDTSELMIRFNTKNGFSDEVLKLCGINVQRIIRDNILDKKIQKLNKEGVGFCPKGHPFVIRRGSMGIFVSCSGFPSCKEKLPLSLDIISDVFGKEYLLCEKHGLPMEIRFNPRRKSRFLGCPRYPECRFTRPL